MQARSRARDADIGLDRFLTTTPPMGGRLKVRISDFVVDELGGEPHEDPRGPYTCAILRLTNWETNRFVRDASERLRISRKKIHFSGTKDKRGVTTRVFTFEAPTEDVGQLSQMPGVEVQRVYRTRSETELGQHVGNAFEIVVRDIPHTPGDAVGVIAKAHDEAEAAGGFPNVFGPQRFGAVRATTHLVGDRILRGDFAGAVRTYLSAGAMNASDDVASAWQSALESNDHAGLLRMTNDDQGFERALLHRLVERPDDPIYALLALPKNLQILFVSAAQSLLFNRVAMQRLAHGLPLGRAVEGDLIAPVEAGEMAEEWIPVTGGNLARVNDEIARGRAVVTAVLPGTEVPFAAGAAGAVEERVLAEAGLTRSNFIVPEHLEWSSKGSRRALSLRPTGWNVETAMDELHPGKAKATFRFALPRGAYATSVLREILKLDELAKYG